MLRPCNAARAPRAAPRRAQRARGEKTVISRVHVADIVGTLRASMARPAAGRIYNVADDLPASRAEARHAISRTP